MRKGEQSRPRTAPGAGDLAPGAGDFTKLSPSPIEPWRPWPWAWAMLAGAALRLWWIHAHPALQGDPQVYAEIARNWLAHGVYGFSAGAGARPTLIRLPGYPLFLAVCFKLFGPANARAVLLVQAALDLGTCALLAWVGRRLWSRQAGMVTLWIAVLCPFTATYSAALLTETLELFATAGAFCCVVRLLELPGPPGLGRAPGQRARVRPLFQGSKWGMTLAACWSYAALLRPDGALLAVALFPSLLVATRGRAWRVPVAAGLLSVLPFIPWTARNWHTFHVFEPLAPRYATDPGEPTHPGFQRWTKTVCVDFTCTQEIYWSLDADTIDFHALPARAFDSPAQAETTRGLFAAYNQHTTLTDAQDAEFAALAEARVRAHPLRFYLLLPAARVADMWLRPRLELLPNDLRWWQYGEHPGETKVACAAAAINLAYLLLAAWGLWRRPPLAGAMLGFFVFRSLLLATIEAPEQRYTLECLPFVFVLAGVALGGRRRSAPLLADDLRA